MSVLYIVYCIDTEGPLYEPFEETFHRIEDLYGIHIEPSKENLKKLQSKKIDLNGLEDEVALLCNPHLLEYNSTWDRIDDILDDMMSVNFRNKYRDDFGNGIIYNWHCMDHVGFDTNLRRRDIGFSNVFRHYQRKINNSGCNDKIHWHFHPLSFNKEAHKCASCYDSSLPLLHEIITRRLIDFNWFPLVNRAGFHVIRQDSSFFLEQWIPYDFSNQAMYDNEDGLYDRFGNWKRAPKEWKPYNPDYTDYQKKGSMNRYTTKCLNIGTRLRLLSDLEIREAFKLADKEGKAILSFTNHDFRDMRKDIEDVYSRIRQISKEFPSVKIQNSDAGDAMSSYLFDPTEKKVNELVFEYNIVEENDSAHLYVHIKNGKPFGSQPYLAFKTKDGRYFHDNFNEYEEQFSYIFDSLTFPLNQIGSVKIASNDVYGNTVILTPLEN